MNSTPKPKSIYSFSHYTNLMKKINRAGISVKSKRTPATRIILYLSRLISVMIIVYLGLHYLIPLITHVIAPPDTNHGYPPQNDTNHDYSPQNLTNYTRVTSENLGFVYEKNASYFDSESNWSLVWRGNFFSSRNWSPEELTPLKILNQGFEDADLSGSRPIDWYIMGSALYSKKGCFEGKRCLYVDVDNSPYGYLMLNSEVVAVREYYNYTFSFDINCIECNNESAYLAIIWLEKKFSGAISESLRHVLFLNNTNGYQRFTINARAPPKTIQAVVGFRIHTESSSIQPRTRLYIDG